jgi:hypothetical protein
MVEKATPPMAGHPGTISTAKVMLRNSSFLLSVSSAP